MPDMATSTSLPKGLCGLHFCTSELSSKGQRKYFGERMSGAIAYKYYEWRASVHIYLR